MLQLYIAVQLPELCHWVLSREPKLSCKATEEQSTKDFPLKDSDFQSKMKDKYETKMDKGDEELPMVLNLWTPTG